MHLLDIYSGSRKWMVEMMRIKVICLHKQMSIKRWRSYDYVGKIWKELNNVGRSYDAFIRNTHCKWLTKVFERYIYASIVDLLLFTIPAISFYVIGILFLFHTFLFQSFWHSF